MEVTYAMVLLSYLAIYVIWGSTFLAIRLADTTIPPLLMMGVRCTTAGLLLLGFGALRRDVPTARAWKPAALAGVLMIALPYASLAWAEQHISSGMAALLVATIPLWLVLLEWLRGMRPTARGALGFASGFCGVVLLVAGGVSTPSAAAPVAAIVVSELAWAIGSVHLRPRLPRPLTLNAGLPLLIGGGLLLAASAVAREPEGMPLRTVSTTSLLALAYLIVFGSIVGFSAYMFLLRVAPASRVGTHAFVNPVIAVALGAGVANEPVTASMIVATVVIVAGVALVLAGARGPGENQGLERWTKDRIDDLGIEPGARRTPTTA